MSLVEMIKPKGATGFGYGSTAEDVTAGLNLAGQTILVTGCNSGLGQEAMRVLSLRGATVVGTARSLDKAKAACAAAGAKNIPVACELSDPASVHAAVATIKAQGIKLDAIICNAGIMALPKLEQAHGYELQFFTNHIGHFILVTGLLEQLKEHGRVVMLSSDAHRGAPSEGIQFGNLAGTKDYSAWRAYGQSKLANMLFANELSRRFAGTSKVANSVHPGVINTNLGRHMGGIANAVLGMAGPLFLKSIPQGAATEVFAAVHPAAAHINGKYLADCNVAKPRKDGEDQALAKRLWEESEKIVAALPKA